MENCGRPCYGCGLHMGPKDENGIAMPVDKFFCGSKEGTEKPPAEYNGKGGTCRKYESLDHDLPVEYDGVFIIR